MCSSRPRPQSLSSLSLLPLSIFFCLGSREVRLIHLVNIPLPPPPPPFKWHIVRIIRYLRPSLVALPPPHTHHHHHHTHTPCPRRWRRPWAWTASSWPRAGSACRSTCSGRRPRCRSDPGQNTSDPGQNQSDPGQTHLTLVKTDLTLVKTQPARPVNPIRRARRVVRPAST